MNVIYDGLGYSFRKIANLIIDGFKRIGYKHINAINAHFSLPIQGFNIIIGDLILACKWGWIYKFRSYKSILWCDTPLCIEEIERHVDFLNDSYCIVTTLTMFTRKMRDIGVKDVSMIPRPIDWYTAQSVGEKGWRKKFGDYIITIGGDNIIFPARKPRKGMDMYDKLADYVKRKYNLNTVAVTNWIYSKNFIRIPLGSLSEGDLLSLIKEARLFVWCSRGEGFGMPPVEAMATGQLVVSSNAPFNEFVIGVKFDCYEETKEFLPEAQKYYYCYDYSFDALRDTVDYALNIDEDERERITKRAREYAYYFRQDFIAELINKV